MSPTTAPIAIEFGTGQVFRADQGGLEVDRTSRMDRPYEVFSRPVLNRIIDTPAKLLAYQAQLLASQGKPEPYPATRPLVGRIDAGRWLGDCACGDAPVIDPEWGLACCLTCGAVYTTTIVLPSNGAALEAALVARPAMATRFWVPGETVADLQAENAARGVA